MTASKHQADLHASYAAWRITYQSSEQAARAAYARVQELEAQLEAIGAGGVEPLRRRECLHKISEPAPAGEYPARPVRYAYDDEGNELFSTAQMFNFVDADRAMRAQAAPADPLDTPLPCDLTAGGVTICKGCPLRTVQLRLQVQADANALLLRRVKEALAAKPAPVALSDAEDAARYRWLRENWSTMGSTYHDDKMQLYVGRPKYTNITPVDIDVAIDAARAAQEGKSHGN